MKNFPFPFCFIFIHLFIVPLQKTRFSLQEPFIIPKIQIWLTRNKMARQIHAYQRFASQILTAAYRSLRYFDISTKVQRTFFSGERSEITLKLWNKNAEIAVNYVWEQNRPPFSSQYSITANSLFPSLKELQIIRCNEHNYIKRPRSQKIKLFLLLFFHFCLADDFYLACFLVAIFLSSKSHMFDYDTANLLILLSESLKHLREIN